MNILRATKNSLVVALIALLAAGSVQAQVYNLFGPVTGVLKGSTTTYQTSAAVVGDITGLWVDASCVGTVALLLNGHCAAAGATPAGSNTQVQYNNSGAFGADASLTWDSTNHRLQLGTSAATTGQLTLFDGATTATFGQKSVSSVYEVFPVNGAGGVGDVGLAITENTGTATVTNSVLKAGAGTGQLGTDNQGHVNLNGSNGSAGQALQAITSQNANAAVWTTIPVFTIKAANTTRTNTAVPTADPDLVYTSVAAGNHAIYCFLIETIPATQGIQVGIGVNAGFVSGTELNVTFSTAGTAGDNTSSGVTTFISQTSPTGTMGAMMQAGFVTNATATVSVAWAQSASGAGATIMNAGSWCYLQ